ncbi:MAG: hypothetical protein SFW67_35535 [Myxococcaceae bacterium]|nr:hypothetical protein [Myxococcaceae bacterium]
MKRRSYVEPEDMDAATRAALDNLVQVSEGKRYATADEVLSDMGEAPRPMQFAPMDVEARDPRPFLGPLNAGPMRPLVGPERPPSMFAERGPEQETDVTGVGAPRDRTLRLEGMTIAPRPMMGPARPSSAEWAAMRPEGASSGVPQPTAAGPPTGRPSSPAGTPPAGVAEPFPASAPAALANASTDWTRLLQEAQDSDAMRDALGGLSSGSATITAALGTPLGASGAARPGWQYQPGGRLADDVERQRRAENEQLGVGLDGLKAQTNADNARTQRERLAADLSGKGAANERAEAELDLRRRADARAQAEFDARMSRSRSGGPTPPQWDLLDHRPIAGTSPTPAQVAEARKAAVAFGSFRAAVEAYREAVKELSLADKLTPAAFNEKKALAAARYADVETEARKRNETGVPSAAELAGVARQVGNASSSDLASLANAEALIDDYAARSFRGYRAKLRPLNVEPEETLAPKSFAPPAAAAPKPKRSNAQVLGQALKPKAAAAQPLTAEEQRELEELMR